MPKKQLVGKVVSAKNTNTVTVEVTNWVKHKLYGKRVKRSSRYAAHCVNPAIGEGAEVTIQESRPISKTKKWIVVAE